MCGACVCVFGVYMCAHYIHNIVKHLCMGFTSFRPAIVLKDQALIGRALGLGGFSLQAEMLQCVVEVFVDLLRFLACLQVGKIFPDLLDQLV